MDSNGITVLRADVPTAMRDKLCRYCSNLARNVYHLSNQRPIHGIGACSDGAHGVRAFRFLKSRVAESS